MARTRRRKLFLFLVAPLLALAVGPALIRYLQASAGAGLAPTDASPILVCTETIAPEPASADSKTSIPSPATPPEFEIEGFVFTDGRNLRLRNPDAPGIETPLSSEWYSGPDRSKVWPERVEGLAAFPSGTKLDFTEWMEDDGETAGLVRAYVRARVTPTDAIRVWDVSADAIETTPMRVVAILEQELLTDAWLEAWRDIYRASEDFRQKLEEEPGLKKRSDLMDSAGLLSEACERARRSRAGEPCVRWRVRAEHTYAGPCAHVLEMLGLRAALPGIPTRWDLEGALDAATTPGELRSAIVAGWGEDALMLAVLLWLPDKTEGEAPEWDYRSRPMDQLCSLTPAEFNALKGDLREWAEHCDSCSQPEEPNSCPQTRALGLELASLDEFDCQRFVMESGARILSVAPGSAAERAGLKPGDIIWKAWDDRTNQYLFESKLLSSKGIGGLRCWLEVLRDSRMVSVAIPIEK